MKKGLGSLPNCWTGDALLLVLVESDSELSAGGSKLLRLAVAGADTERIASVANESASSSVVDAVAVLSLAIDA